MITPSMSAKYVSHSDDVCGTYYCFSFGYIQTDYYECGENGYDCQDVDSACYGDSDNPPTRTSLTLTACAGDFISDGWCDEGELYFGLV
ncbi:unnamed protein product [Ectocarpus sp. 13 AM-2016]